MGDNATMPVAAIPAGEKEKLHPVCTKGQIVGAIAGPLIFFVLLWVELSDENPKAAEMAGITLWTAIWWISGVAPLSVTSLLPFILMPFAAILPGSVVAGLYLNWVVFLFIGAFLVGKGLEKTNLHKRVALRVLVKLGGSPLMLLFAYMLVAWAVSMFASNTATTAMLLPLVRAIFEKSQRDHADLEESQPSEVAESSHLEENLHEKEALAAESVSSGSRTQAEVMKRFEKGVLIGVAYAATCGGIATIIGTAPNTVLVSQVELIFGQVITFGQWFAFGFPIALILLFLAFVVVAFFYVPRGKDASLVSLDRDFFRRMQDRQGGITRDEKVVAVVQVVMLLLWLLRPYTINEYTDFVTDGEIACGMALLLFLVPAMNLPEHKDDNGRTVRPRILNRQDVEDLPWGLFLLFGSGFAISAGWTESGLSILVGEELRALTDLPTFALIFLLSLTVCFLTEVASNTAISNVMIAIGASIAIQSEINPYIVLIPSTLAASLAFMLPIATPPNAVIFSTGLLKFNDMIFPGFILNVMGVLVVSVMFYAVIIPVMSIDLDNAPEWLI